jgi:hypothetical protein
MRDTALRQRDVDSGKASDVAVANLRPSETPDNTIKKRIGPFLEGTPDKTLIVNSY